MASAMPADPDADPMPMFAASAHALLMRARQHGVRAAC
jgi:hypothetical protein